MTDREPHITVQDLTMAYGGFVIQRDVAGLAALRCIPLDREGLSLQIDITPLQVEQLAPAEPSVQGQEDHRFQIVGELYSLQSWVLIVAPFSSPGVTSRPLLPDLGFLKRLLLLMSLPLLFT